MAYVYTLIITIIIYPFLHFQLFRVFPLSFEVLFSKVFIHNWFQIPGILVFNYRICYQKLLIVFSSFCCVRPNITCHKQFGYFNSWMETVAIVIESLAKNLVVTMAGHSTFQITFDGLVFEKAICQTDTFTYCIIFSLSFYAM